MRLIVVPGPADPAKPAHVILTFDAGEAIATASAESQLAREFAYTILAACDLAEGKTAARGA